MLIDSHCHINSEEMRLEARTILNRASSAGVGKIINVGCDYEDSCEAVALVDSFPHVNLYASVGIHPHEAKRYDEKIPDEFQRLIKNDRVVAIGEIGLDYHYDNSPREIQQKIFDLQLKFAAKNNMPVILHIREAMEPAMKILREYPSLSLLFHCYSGGLEYLDEILERKAMCSFGGAVTWNTKGSEELREVVRKIPIENILLETDSPYMSPVPFRGKRNEPAYVKYVYEAVANEREMSVDDLANQIEINAKNFFKWSD